MMMPVVYVETNWLIALLFPHDELHEAAKGLLTLTKSGSCELRVPHIAFVEARITMKRIALTFQDELNTRKEQFLSAYRAGWSAFKRAYEGLDAPELIAYHQRELVAELDAIAENRAVHRFAHPEDEIKAMATLWNNVDFSQHDAEDFYILAAILTDRAKLNRARPAIFMSSNHKQFARRVPPDFYDAHRLVYRRDFSDMKTAEGKWRNLFGNA